MANITMCSAKKCDKRERCYRYKALSAGDTQRFVNFEEEEKDTKGRCKYSWEMR